jgi:hypothetical protein
MIVFLSYQSKKTWCCGCFEEAGVIAVTYIESIVNQCKVKKQVLINKEKFSKITL